MHTFLERLGRFCARRHWYVIGVWLVIVVGLVALRATFGGSFVNDYTVPGSASDKGKAVLATEFPTQSSNSGQIVFAAPAGAKLSSSEDLVNQSVTNVSHLDHVLSATSPYAASNSPTVSTNGTIAYATVNFDTATNNLNNAYLDQLHNAVKPATDAGLTVEYGGSAGQIANHTDDTKSEAIGLACALILLLIMFVSLVAAAIPLVAAGFSVAAGLSTLGLLAAAFTFPTTAPTIATLLGLGVAVDYGLFQVARHREQVDRGGDLIESIGKANSRSGGAIVVAGTTVIIAILGLFVAGVPFISALGVSAAIVVAVTMLSALTLVPALMGLARGTVRSFVDRRRERRERRDRAAADKPPVAVHDDHAHENSAFARWGRRVSGRPWPWAIGAVILLVIITIPLFFITFGQLDAGTDPTSDTDRRAYDLISEGFGVGANGPITVIVKAPAGASSSDFQTLLTNTQQTLQKTSDVASVWPPSVNQGGTAAILNVIPKTNPQAAATTSLVNNLRDNVLPSVSAPTYLTGTTVGNVDFTERSVQRLPWLIGAVVLLSLLLLTAAFRSLAIGIKAAVMNLLSVGAAYGVVVAVFQWGWGSSLIGMDEKVPIPAFVPMLMFAIVFGLSMDYEVFLLTRVHEAYVRTRDPHRSVAIGIGGTARVITTAAAVMVVVFSSFVADTDPIVKMLALGMAVSVLIDASVVRMVLVPAIMSLLGDHAWWVPRWLDKILPHIDVEGDGAPVPAEQRKPVPVGR
ncbi:MAG TPA: MMPL family transporter [Micromonosporaceae bacterium]